jgi:ribonuclease PH
VQYNVANFSKSERKQFNKNDRCVFVSTHTCVLACIRASNVYNPLDLILFSRQIKDFSALLRQTFESIILTELYPRSEIDICVQVLQSDGGAIHQGLSVHKTYSMNLLVETITHISSSIIIYFQV